VERWVTWLYIPFETNTVQITKQEQCLLLFPCFQSCLWSYHVSYSFHFFCGNKALQICSFPLSPYLDQLKFQNVYFGACNRVQFPGVVYCENGAVVYKLLPRVCAPEHGGFALRCHGCIFYVGIVYILHFYHIQALKPTPINMRNCQI